MTTFLGVRTEVVVALENYVVFKKFLFPSGFITLLKLSGERRLPSLVSAFLFVGIPSTFVEQGSSFSVSP